MSVNHRKQLDVRRVEGDTVARFRERRLGLSNLDALRKEIMQLAVRPRLCLDFATVECVSGAALGLLVSLHLKMRAAGTRLTLRRLAPAVHEIFEVTHLTRVFKIKRPSAARELVGKDGADQDRPARWQTSFDPAEILHV
jgi:anti-anti-sigma factor